ncbi:molybdenum ABC transporter ATP-binding protein [Ahrensia marina]|uniref:molybdenum ABC transporter ATP-binding protein n=1 Tax=Ahrensia marina TaxID=1514904 RepID=UPI0035CF08EE
MTLQIAIQKQQGDFALDLDVTTGDGVTALFGRSGAGKSTVIKAVAGLVTPDSGHIQLGDQVLFDSASRTNQLVHKRRIGLVFQDARLFPHLSVLKNLLYGARFSDGSVKRADAVAMAELLGLDGLLNRKPSGLSGGEAQRVAIGRALLSKPKLLMMDEPLAGLDQARKADVLALIEKVRDVVGVPILYVSHTLEEVLRLANHVAIIADGKCVDQGAPDALLGGSGTGLARTVRARLVMKNSSDGLSELALAGGRLFVPQVDAPLGWVLQVEIAARDVMLSLQPPEGLSALNVLACQITELRASGTNPSAVDVMLACGEDSLVAQVTRRSVEQMGLQPGLGVYAVIKSVALAQTSGAVDTVDV